jgi:hypothetical protein
MTIRKTAIALVLASGLASRASAATPVPNTFTAGTPARAADVNANFQFVMEQIAAALPTGTVLPFAGPLDTAVPSGFLACDGASYVTTAYQALFNVIGYTYGGSNGSFQVPDLRGEFARGLDNMGTVRGAANHDPEPGGRGLGSGQKHALQDFRLSQTDRDYSGKLGVTSVYTAQTNWGYNVGGISMATDEVLIRAVPVPGTNGALVPVNANVATETRPRNVALNFIIKT